MKYKKENLTKLLKLVEEISSQPENEWFKNDLKKKVTANSSINNSSTIDEIYEYCIKLIIKDHAEKFYADFKLLGIKERLIEDFIRMEKFRRDDNFEDFCLAAYQQLESIINELIKAPEFVNYYRDNRDMPAILRYDKTTKTYIINDFAQPIGKLIFQTVDLSKIDFYLNSSVQSWFFNHKFRAVIYFYYFNKEIKATTDLFDRVYEIGNILYQGRNLNHRGVVQSEYQQGIIDHIIPNQHKYYFKFLGFLEDFITSVNKNI